MIRLLKIIVIWLVVGVLVSYGAACIECVLWPNGEVGPATSLPQGGKMWGQAKQPWMSGFDRFDAEPLLPLPTLGYWTPDEVVKLALPGLPARPVTSSDVNEPWWPRIEEAIDCYGWPARSWGIKYGTRCRQYQRFSILAGIPLPGEALHPRRFPLDEVPNALPIAPLVGLLINAPLYGLVAFGAWQCLLAARRSRRRRRGLCVACGYQSNGAAICPECGHSGATT